jgi:DNA-binding NarL/FixJ family response regulator
MAMTESIHAAPCRMVIAGSSLFRDGLAALLARTHSVAAVCPISEAEGTLRSELPGVLILELAASDCGEFDALAAATRLPQPPRILVVGRATSQLMLRGVRAGADGCASYEGGAAELRLALDVIQAGGRYVSPVISDLLLQDEPQNGTIPSEQRRRLLTPRETEVLDLLAEGFNGPEIARQLSVSPKTIHVHRTRLLQKLHAHNTAQLLRRGLELGLVTFAQRGELGA